MNKPGVSIPSSLRFAWDVPCCLLPMNSKVEFQSQEIWHVLGHSRVHDIHEVHGEQKVLFSSSLSFRLHLLRLQTVPWPISGTWTTGNHSMVVHWFRWINVVFNSGIYKLGSQILRHFSMTWTAQADWSSCAIKHWKLSTLKHLVQLMPFWPHASFSTT